jgi:hypothetical protein
MIRFSFGTTMPPNAMVKSRKGGRSQYICCCQTTRSQMNSIEHIPTVVSTREDLRTP